MQAEDLNAGWSGTGTRRVPAHSLLSIRAFNHDMRGHPCLAGGSTCTPRVLAIPDAHGETKEAQGSEVEVGNQVRS